MRTDLLSTSPLPAGDRPSRVLSVVINPGSGGNDAQQTRDLLARVFDDAGVRHEFVPVASPGDLQEASRRAALRVSQSGGVLVAVGGDGTINTVAEAAWRAGCVLGIVPQGTFNYFARSHGIPLDPQAAALALVRGQVEAVQVGEVNGRLFLVNASVGLYPQLLQDREAFKSQFGRHRWVAMLSGLVTLFEWRRQLTIEIDLDGQRTVLVTPTLFVGNNRLQLERIGIEPAVAGRVGDGCLAAIALRPVGNWRMLLLVLRGALGRLGEAEQVESFAFRTLTVRFGRRRRMKVAADGEVGLLTPPLRFSVAAAPLQVLLPQPQDRAEAV
jgi:diacylglycerol kinase family enzyme